MGHGLPALGKSIVVAFAALAWLAALEMASPLERHPLRSRLRGALIFALYLPASFGSLAVLSALWTRLGVKPLVVLRLDEWFAWAGTLSVLLAAITAAFVADFFGYWLHRAQHVWFWRFHAVHHSVRELHALNSYHHASEGVFRFALMMLPMSFVAIYSESPPTILAALLIVQPYFLHSPTRLHFGPLRYIFADNRFHRIHHSLEPHHFDKNFSAVTPLWDWLFGTAYFPKADEWPDVGLADVHEPTNIREWLDLPLRFRRRAHDKVAVGG